MTTHVALIAHFDCTEDVYREAVKLPFMSVLHELDDDGSFGYQNVTIENVMDGTFENGQWCLRCDWHEDDWFEADTNKMESFLEKLTELGARGAVMAYQYVNAVPPEIKLWRLGRKPVEIELNAVDPESRALLEEEELDGALVALTD